MGLPPRLYVLEKMLSTWAKVEAFDGVVFVHKYGQGVNSDLDRRWFVAIFLLKFVNLV